MGDQHERSTSVGNGRTDGSDPRNSGQGSSQAYPGETPTSETIGHPKETTRRERDEKAREAAHETTYNWPVKKRQRGGQSTNEKTPGDA